MRFRRLDKRQFYTKGPDTMAQRYILLDRDGTINVDTHYLSRPEDVRLERNAAQGLKKMMQMGFGLVVVTNQSGIGRGYFDPAAVEAIHHRLDDLLAQEGVSIAAYFVCPHRPEEACSCRKPLPGLAEQARARFGFDPTQCWMIGDKEADIGLGAAIGAKTLLVRTGKGAKTEAAGLCQPDAVVDDLAAAAAVIESLMTSPSAESH